MSVSCMSPTSSTASTTSHHHVLVTHDDILAKLDEEGAAYDTTENSDSLDLKCMVYDLNTDASPFHTVLVCLAASKRVNESAVLARLGLWSAPKSTLTMSTDCEASVGQCPGSIGPLYLPDSEGVVCLITSEVVASHIPIRVSAGHQEYVYLEEPSALLHLVDASEVLLLDVDAWLDLTLQEDLVLFTSNDDPIEVVCTQQQLEPLVALWSAGMTIVSIDSEREPKTQAISLIQVSLYGPHRLRRDFIIDVQLFDDKEYLGRELAELFVSFNSLKILHSATNDLRHFEKNFEACECIRERVNNLLDTQILGSRLGQTKLGLAKLAEEYLGIHMDKTLQTADWSRRPLTPAMLHYAICDAKVLLPLIKAMELKIESSEAMPLALHNSISGKTIGHSAKQQHPMSAPRERQGGRSWHVKAPVYGNIALEDPTGLLMCRISKQKRNWYVRKGLADEIEPSRIRLKFFPKGPGHAGNSVYLNRRENICVVCGASEFISRHFIVPNCYRKHLPPEYKSHCPYDIVLMCVQCKMRANVHADELREKYATELDAPVQGVGCRNTNYYRARRAARILLSKDGPRMPEKKRQEFWQALHDVGIYDDPNEAFSLSESSDADEYMGKQGNTDSTFASHGEVVVKKLGEHWPEFVEAWRKDFVTFMQPKFLPEDWSPDKDWRAVSEVELEAERRVMYAEHLRHLGKEVPINDKPIRPARR